MYAAPQHLVTTTRTGIKTFADLKGKKISLSSPGGGDQLLSMMILEAAGWDPEGYQQAAAYSARSGNRAEGREHRCSFLQLCGSGFSDNGDSGCT